MHTAFLRFQTAGGARLEFAKPIGYQPMRPYDVRPRVAKVATSRTPIDFIIKTSASNGNLIEGEAVEVLRSDGSVVPIEIHNEREDEFRVRFTDKSELYAGQKLRRYFIRENDAKWRGQEIVVLVLNSSL